MPTFNLDRLSEDELLALREAIHRMLTTKRAELAAKLETLEELFGPTPVGPRKRGVKKGTKLKPKYRGPDGELWSGRGIRPHWFAKALKRGRKAEDFLIN